MSDRMTEEELAMRQRRNGWEQERIRKGEPVSTKPKHLVAQIDDLLQALKAEREHSKQLEAKLERVRCQPPPWPLLDDCATDGHVSAAALRAALQEKQE